VGLFDHPLKTSPRAIEVAIEVAIEGAIEVAIEGATPSGPAMK
jgi:hypothetical protein